jgi:hypothetical protein
MSIIAGEPPVRLVFAGRGDLGDDREGNDAAYNPARVMVAELSKLAVRTADLSH